MATSRPTGCCRRCFDARAIELRHWRLLRFVCSSGQALFWLTKKIRRQTSLAVHSLRSQPSWRRHPETDIFAYAALEILEDTDERKDRGRRRRAPVGYVSSSRRPGRTARPQGY